MMDQVKLKYIDYGIPNFIVNDLDPLTSKMLYNNSKYKGDK